MKFDNLNFYSSKLHIYESEKSTSRFSKSVKLKLLDSSFDYITDKNYPMIFDKLNCKGRYTLIYSIQCPPTPLPELYTLLVYCLL